MHELSIALSKLDLAADEAGRCEATAVHSIHLRLGPLAGVVKEALVSAFDMARMESSFPDAQLIIEDTCLSAYCPTCQKDGPVVSVQEICCRACGTPTPRLVSGHELEVVAMEIQ